MPVLVLKVTLLDAAFHGRRDGGEPEWPPSPLRAFQALVAAAAARRRGTGPEPGPDAEARAALEGLERLPPPLIVAPRGEPAPTGRRTYVPNNAADLVAAAWARGSADADIADHRVEKDVRPVRLVDGDAIHYVWDLPDGLPGGSNRTLADVARGITHLGWGIDQAVADLRLLDEAPAVSGHVWRPAAAGGTPLRVPVPGTLSALIARHGAFLRRVRAAAEGPTFEPVPPLAAYAAVAYRCATAGDGPAPGRPFAAFRLVSADPDGRNPAFRAAEGHVVAAMTRHAAGDMAERTHCPPEWIKSVVHGHGDGDRKQLVGPPEARRFSYLPLPTIEHRGESGRVVGPIRRVLVAEAPGGDGRDAAWASRLGGADLAEEGTGESRAALAPLPASDWVLRQYTGPDEGAAEWTSVTPVLLPGYDDPAHFRRRLADRERRPTADEQKRLLARLSDRIDELLRKALRQAGFADEIADAADLDWRKVAFLPGARPAWEFDPPAHLKMFPRYHVRIRFRHPDGRPLPVRGPLAVGAGRHYGLGLLAVADNG
jgi:CRISPR-associated protein Csb2